MGRGLERGNALSIYDCCKTFIISNGRQAMLPFKAVVLVI